MVKLKIWKNIDVHDAEVRQFFFTPAALPKLCVIGNVAQ